LDWNQIYLDLAPRVYNFFRYRLGQSIDAEELTARTFEKAWAAREQYRRDLAGFSTWLFRIAQNLVVDDLRSRRNQVSLDHVVDMTTPESTEGNIERQSDLRRLSLLTREFPSREQDLLALKYGAGMSNRDIARLSGLTESNVGSILHRLVQNLRARW
jgi:RNA polymerase sigma-70 factor (ECF subfamily)